MWAVLLTLACGGEKENPCADGTVRTAPGFCEAEPNPASGPDDELVPSGTDSGRNAPDAEDTGSRGSNEPDTDGAAAEEAAALAHAATAFLDALDADQRDEAQFDLTDPERSAWSNLPVGDFPREGVRIGDMTEEQRTLAWNLVAASLSARGQQRVDEILTMESIVEAIGWGSASLDDYYFVVFDIPSTEVPWGWQLDGHHLALNFTVVGSQVTMTPSLWGVEPSTWDEGEHAGLEPLSMEVEQALAWANLLTATQLATAAEGPGSDPSLAFGPATEPSMWPAIQGLPVTDMTTAQQTALTDLIGVYVGNLPTQQAADRMEEIANGLDEVSVVWVGDTTPGAAIYYRIHGPRLLIEFDHVSGPNHIHSVYRDPTNDYGSDWLSKHLLSHHADDIRAHGWGAWARMPSLYESDAAHPHP